MVRDNASNGNEVKKPSMETGTTTQKDLDKLRMQAEKEGVANMSEADRQNLDTDIRKSSFMDKVGSAIKTTGSVALTVLDSPAQLAKWGTEKLTGSETAGDVAKWLTRAGIVAGGAYLGAGLLREGAEAAYGAGSMLLDRITVGGGQLFPAMDMPAAPPSLQNLPSGDIFEGA
jgi:hypothetical protein